MADESVTISRKEYEQLMKDSILLGALEAFGVDNWEGYDEAYSDATKDSVKAGYGRL